MSQEQELRKALEESERRYREVFETNTAVKLVIDPDTGALVDVNGAACRFYGYEREKLLQMRIQQINIMPPERIQEEMARARSERRLYFRFQHRLASGEVRDVDCYSGPVPTTRFLAKPFEPIDFARAVRELCDQVVC